MPGGLTRINAKTSGLLIPNKDRGYSKDTWVLTREPDKQVNFWRQAPADQLIKPLLGALPSRAAENLFWAGRYAERTEATSRLLRSILVNLRDPDDQRSLDPLVARTDPCHVDLPWLCRCEARRRNSRTRAQSFCRWPVTSTDQGACVPRCADWAVPPISSGICCQKMRGGSSTIYRRTGIRRLAVSQIGSGRLHDSINNLIQQLSAFSGLTHENMSRETAWLLLNIGRRLERALNLIELLRATLVPCYDPSMEAHMMEDRTGHQQQPHCFQTPLSFLHATPDHSGIAIDG